MTLPNFLIIGAAKAGTTSLYEHFRAHPQIFMPRLKEARFFSYDGRPNRVKFPVQTLEEYAALFEEADEEKAVGEATPHYLTFPEAAGRIHALLPEARLIASLRNPVDRSFSIYQMNQRNHAVNAGIPYTRAVQTDPHLQDGYSRHLERFLALFPREQIRIILLEDLETRPRATLAGLFEFLGVDPAFTPDLSRVANPGGTPRIKLLHDLLANRKLVAVSRRVMPEALVTPLKALRTRNLRRSALPAADRGAATAFFRDDILRTQDLIGRDLSHWLHA
jgi:sulfotransferase family protein